MFSQSSECVDPEGFVVEEWSRNLRETDLPLGPYGIKALFEDNHFVCPVVCPGFLSSFSFSFVSFSYSLRG